jgi:exosome complex RNA-binding protein Csl4
LGFKQEKQQIDNDQKNVDNAKTILNVVKELETSIVPDLHSVVIGRVSRINPRFANVDILVVGNKTLKEAFTGIVRFENLFYSYSFLFYSFTLFSYFFFFFFCYLV